MWCENLPSTIFKTAMLSLFLSVSKGVFKISIFFINSVKLFFWVSTIDFLINFSLLSISSFNLLFLFFPPLLTISLSFSSSFPISSFSLLCIRALALGNATLLYFIISKNHFITYTIPFYNTSSISNFYFSILLIKIIYLHNKIIYIKTQIKTKTQIYNHLLPLPPQRTYPN